jgi:hypothetical protein
MKMQTLIYALYIAGSLFFLAGSCLGLMQVLKK